MNNLRDEWTTRGRCVGVDPNVFFPDEASGQAWSAEAKRICKGCEVRTDCLEAALRRGEVGVWGGLTDQERQELRIERGLAVAPKGPRQLQPCGTHGAYQRHRKNGEEPCDPCKAANAAKSRQNAAKLREMRA